jgi:hypothetical protein
LDELVLKDPKEVGDSLGGYALALVYLFLGYLVFYVLHDTTYTIVPKVDPTRIVLLVNNTELYI